MVRLPSNKLKQLKHPRWFNDCTSTKLKHFSMLASNKELLILNNKQKCLLLRRKKKKQLLTELLKLCIECIILHSIKFAQSSPKLEYLINQINYSMYAAYMLARLAFCLRAQIILKLILFAQFSQIFSEG